MAIRQMHHVGVVVDDLAAATAFFVALGLEGEGTWEAEDPAVDRILGLDGVRSEVAMLRTPDDRTRLELSRFLAPPAPGVDAPAPAHAPGLRHLAFEVDDLDATLAALRPLGGELVGEVVEYGGTYRLCYLRGPAGIILELAEQGG